MPFSLGVPQFHYSVDRNILATTPSWVRVRRPRDLRRGILAIAAKVGATVPGHAPFLFTTPYFPRVDIIHTFNAAADVKVPWIATFEAVMPRMAGPAPAGEVQRRLQLLGRPQCRSLLAMSRSAASVTTLDWSRRLSSREVDDLGKKMAILHPPQSVYETYETKPRRVRPLFAVVGRQFYRKGGLEFLEAAHLMFERGIRDWDAVVVGSLQSYGDYASKSDAQAEMRARQLLHAMSRNIKHHESLPPVAIHGLFREATFHVLPTLADTYGYSVLEASPMLRCA